MVVQKLAKFCRNKNSLKVVIARLVTGDNLPRNVCCAESCCFELSRVTSPLKTSQLWFCIDIHVSKAQESHLGAINNSFAGAR